MVASQYRGRDGMSEISTISLACKAVARGAFTWGVLDTLLERGNFRFDGVSGTSAGAMNAASVWPTA